MVCGSSRRWLVLTLALLALPASAQERTPEAEPAPTPLPPLPGATPPAPPPPSQAAPQWDHAVELSFVQTGGNSEAGTLGVKLGAEGFWPDWTVTLEGTALRAESEQLRWRVIGPPDDFEIIEQSRSEVTAENYLLRGRFDRQIGEDRFWFAGTGWERNTFAGFLDRYSWVVGAGKMWRDTRQLRLSTDAGVTYTRQQDVAKDLTLADNFIGLGITSKLKLQISPSTSLLAELLVDENVDELRDLRTDLTSSMTVAISDRTALKAGVRFRYDNRPAHARVSREFPEGVRSGEFVLVELDRLDTTLTTALVLTF